MASAGAMTDWLRRPGARWVFAALACLAAGLLAYGLVGSPSAPAVFWPPVGLALAVAMLWGMPMVVPAALGTALAVLLQGEGPVPALLLGLACAAQAMVGALLLARAHVGPRLTDVADLLRLALHGGVLAGMAAMPVAHMALADAEGFWEMALHLQVVSLAFSQLNAVLIFTTLPLCVLSPACPQRVPWSTEAVLVLLGLGVVALLLAHPEMLGLAARPLWPYPLLPFLLWLGLRADARFVALGLAWIYAVMSAHDVWGMGLTVLIADDEWVRPLHGFVTVVSLSFLALAILMGVNRRLGAASLAEALAQRDALVREVHHRIKNNLQIVVGLLRRDAAQHPEIRPMLESAISQVQSIAVVHGLHGRVTRDGVMLCELLPAICRAISDLSGVPMVVEGIQEGCGKMRIQESETVALALILNELVSNAVKHTDAMAAGLGPRVTLTREGEAGRVGISNPGSLPPGFDFSRGVGLGTGLGLVKALMPSPGVWVEFQQRAGWVVAEIRLGPPLLVQVD